MALAIQRDCRAWLDEYDVTSDTYNLDLKGETTVEPTTNFASGGSTEGLLCLKTSDWALKTYYDAALIDPVVADLDAQATALLSLAQNDEAGSVAYIVYGQILSSTRGLEVGKVAMLDVSGKAAGAPGMARGWLLGAKSTVTTTGTTTGQQNGALITGRNLYASLHVFAASGTLPTLDVKVQSDDNGAFSSATDRITFAQATAVGAQLGSAAGPITDDYWRLSYTVAGTGPSFTFAVVMAFAKP